jgi:4-aminobutyrate aminotransferase / (S)-3-amino-2-methylpropionate transaminase / 5-aminovalerate transaminase
MAKKKPGTKKKAAAAKVTGPRSAKWLKVSHDFEAGCMSQQAPVVLDHGKGVMLYDVDGKAYIDWTSGVLVTNVGHSHPKMVEAVQKQAALLMNVYDFPTPPRLELARRLVRLMPRHLNRCFLITTGSEATEAAMRLAKRYTGRNEIMAFWGGFHGRTAAAMSIGGKASGKKGFGTMMPGALFSPYAYCYRCPFKMTYPKCDMFCAGWLDQVKATESTDDIAALIVEPYQGAAGFIIPPKGWLTRVQQWCRANDVLFILDEVQASFGRTGKMFALEHEGLKPNMVCVGKGIGSGVTTAALMSEERLFACLTPGEMSSTHGGNPLCTAGSLAVLDIFKEEKLEDNAAKIGRYMLGRFKKMQKDCRTLGDVRGQGLVMGLEFVKDKKTKEPAADITVEVINRCVANGLLVGRVGFYGNVIRVAPPLVITRAEAEKSCDIMAKVLKSL